MNVEYWPRIRASFICGLIFGILGVFATEIIGSAGVSLWVKIFQAILSSAYVLAGFITIGRAYKRNKPVITEAIDHFFLGIASGISGAQLLLPGLSLNATAPST